jgi:hypothetical protein
MPESLHKLTEAELRFLIKFAISRISAGAFQGLHRGSVEKREQSLGIATDIVVAQLGRAHHEVYRPAVETEPLLG